MKKSERETNLSLDKVFEVDIFLITTFTTITNIPITTIHIIIIVIITRWRQQLGS